MSNLSDLIQQVNPSSTIQMFTKAKEMEKSGIDVINLSVGELDLDTPKHICDAAKEALDKQMTKYTLVDGTHDLKIAICNKFRTENNLDFDPSDIIVSCGAKQSIFNAIGSITNPNDEIIIPVPSWVSYIDIVKLFRGKPVLINTKDSNFILTADQLEQNITSKTKAIMLNSPCNPTGAVYSEKNFIAIAEILSKNPQMYIISDDIYEHVIFDGQKFFNILNVAPDLSNRVITINGVSKSYSMTGFRIGYCASKNKEILKLMRIIQSQSTSSPCSISQYAAKIALESRESIEFVKTMQKEIQNRRNVIYDQLKNIYQIDTFRPSGAFYFFCSIEKLIGKKYKEKTISSDVDFCNILLENFHVCLVSGSAFGLENHFRLSFAIDIKKLQKGVEEIKNFIDQLN